MAEETRKPRSRKPEKADSKESGSKNTEKKYDLKGFRIIAAGYLIIAAALFALQIARVFETRELFEYGRIVLDAIAWLIILFGASKLMRLNAEFPKLGLTAIAAEVCLAGEAFFIWRNLKAGMGDGAFIDFFVLFMFFMGRAVLFYSYAKVLRGLSPIVERIGINGKEGKTFYQTWFFVSLIVFICLVLIPVGAMFSQVAQFIASAVGGGIAFFAQLYICKILLDTYNAGIGRNLTKKRKQKSSAKKSSKGGKSGNPSAGSPKNPNRGSTGRETMAMRKKKAKEQGAGSKPAPKPKASEVKTGGSAGEEQRKVSRKDLAKQRTER